MADRQRGHGIGLLFLGRMQTRNDSITIKGLRLPLLPSFDSPPSDSPAMAISASFRSLSMLRRAMLALLAGLIATACQANAASPISQMAASQAGLTRAWFGQVALDVSQHTVTGAALKEGRLFVLSSSGQLQALDAETGQTLWSERVGKVARISLGPVAKGNLVAVINGTTLYLLDSTTGNEISRHNFRSAPSAAPAIGKDYVYVPLTNGHMEGIPLNSKSKIRWNYTSSGHTHGAPAIVADRVLWATDRDYLYGALAKGGAAYRFRASGHLLTPVTSIENEAIVVTEEGYLYAINVEKGQQRWRASVGVSVNHPAVTLPPSAKRPRIFVGTETPSLHAFDPEMGAERWVAPGVNGFVAASAERVYGVSPRGQLSVLNAQTGRVVAHLPGVQGLVPLPNNETDRLYFLSPSGFVQCLHETGAKEPYWHLAAAEAGDATGEAAAGEVTDEAPFTSTEEPFAEEPAEEKPPVEEEPADDPFGVDPFDDSSSEDDPLDEDDPFGGF